MKALETSCQDYYALPDYYTMLYKMPFTFKYETFVSKAKRKK